MSIRYARRTILAALLCSAIPVCAQSQLAVPAVAVDATLTIEQAPPAADPLLIHVTLTLHAEGRCVFATFSPAAEALADWIVLDPDGRRIPYRGPVAKVDYRDLVRKPERGDSLTATVDLSAGGGESTYFDFSVQGTYRVQLVWSMSLEWADPEYRSWFADCEPWSGSVASNILDIRVGAVPAS